MSTRTICWLAVGLMALAMVGVSSGQSGESNAALAVPEQVATQAVTEVQAAVTNAISAESNAVSAAIDTNTMPEGPAPQVTVDPADSARETMYGPAESRSQHAARVNATLFKVSSLILGLFILGRLALLWKITQNRKKLGRGNSFDS